MAALPQAIGWWKRHCPKISLDGPLLGVMALLAHAPPSAISGLTQRLQLSAAQARALLHTGDAPVLESAKPEELAALTTVARAILNLHETITRN